MIESIGPYRVEGEIGRGGMGVVYRATDPRLGRAVALKALPVELAEDPDRLARFEIEARSLASLDHVNVAGIHGLEEQDGRRYLVLEFVEGETLEALLAGGRLPVDRAIDIAIQIARGLEAAHEAGVVHRDLKPANVKVTSDDRVKLLDFGLARVVGSGPAGSDADSPTMTVAAANSPTLAGAVMGTAGYMSPEQARGKPVDRRSDVFAFGCVLYEMLCGSRAFGGETVADALGALMHRDPDWSELPAATPPELRRLLERCTKKDRTRRLQDVGDARIELEDLLEHPSATDDGSGAAVRSGARKRTWLLATLAFVAGAAVAGVALWNTTRADRESPTVRRFELSGMGMPIDAFQGLTLSPDGSRLIVRARDGDGNEILQMRSFDDFELTRLPDSESGWLPAFSPSGEDVAFYSLGEIKRVDLERGIARTIARAPAGFSGGVWLPDDTILFSGLGSDTLFRVPADGGEAEPFPVDGVPPGSLLTSPSGLPGGRSVLVTLRIDDDFDVAVVDLEDRSYRIVAQDGFTPMWAATGHVIYQQGANGPLMALPFDPERSEPTGVPFPVQTDVAARVSYQVRTFSVSGDGTLAFIPDTQSPDQASLAWVEPGGRETPIAQIDRVADTPRVSPDGSRIAFRTPAPNCDLWVHDLERDVTTRITREGDNHGVAWMPDGRRLAFARKVPPDDWAVCSAPADGAGDVASYSGTILEDAWVTSVSPDGKHALVSLRGATTGGDVGVVSLEDGTSSTVVGTRFNEEAGTFSPDGTHVAYTSNESGRFEVYVRPFPALDTRVQVSSDGGTSPVWSHDGTKLYFRKGRRVFATPVRMRPSFTALRPEEVFEANFSTSGGDLADFDVAPDGERFAVFRLETAERQVEVKIVLNWFEDVRRLAGE